MSWTDERVELLSQLWLEGKSASQISAALGAGLTRNAVIGKVHRLGLAGRAKSAGSPSAGPASSVPRAASAIAGAPRRPAPRVHSGSVSNVAAVASARTVHGNTALRLAPEALEMEAQPARVEQEVVVPMSLRVTIVDLRESMCRWPLGDPASSEFRYCGSPTHATGPYCNHHGKLAYQPSQDRRRERERDRRPMLAR